MPSSLTAEPPASAAARTPPQRASLSPAPRPASSSLRRWLRGRLLKIAIALAVSAAVLGASFVAWQRTKRNAVSPIHYEVAAVDRGTIAAKVTATGTVSALVTVLVGSQVSGRIESLGADFGSTVKKGQTIARIEPSFFQAAVAQSRAAHASATAAIERAQAQVELAERTYRRAKSLHEQGIASRAELDTAEAEVTSAKTQLTSAQASVRQTRAALDQAELNLRYTTIVSPIDGVVISRNVDVGQTVAATLQAPTLFTIAQDLDRMQVDTNVAEADVGKVRPGMSVFFTVDAYPTRTFAGTVRQVRDNAQTIQNVVTYDAVIDVENSERLLKPGMTASVTFTYATHEDVLRLPNGAVRFRPQLRTIEAMTKAAPSAPGTTTAEVAPLARDERVIWIRRGMAAIPVKVKLGISDGMFTEVLGGDLNVGDEAIIEAEIQKEAS